MQMITKGYGWLSIILMIVGLILVRLLWPVLDSSILYLRNYQYGKYFLLFGAGIPLAYANILETKYIWGRFLKNTELDLLGVSVGFLIGLMIGYIGPPV